MDTLDEKDFSTTLNAETGHTIQLDVSTGTIYVTKEALARFLKAKCKPLETTHVEEVESNHPICQRCSSDRILDVESHGRDCHSYNIKEHECSGYLPDDFGIGGDDDLTMKLCMDCGQVQGKWPRPETALERGEETGV